MSEEKVFYFGKSKDGLWYRFGSSNETARWYSVSEKVSGFVAKLKMNDEVVVKSVDKDGKPNIVFLSRGGTPIPQFAKNGNSSYNGGGGGKKTYVPRQTAQVETNSRPSGMRNNDSKDEMIIKQTVLKAACQSVGALTGVFSTVDEVIVAVKKAFDELLPLVTSNVGSVVETATPQASEPVSNEPELEDVAV